MSREQVIEHLGTIAKSGTAEFLQSLTGEQQKDSQLIGQFGVGFYSAFIVADKVRVGVLISGSGTNLQALIDACADPDFPAPERTVYHSRKHHWVAFPGNFKKFDTLPD